jgi:hypothetical protein
MFALPTKISTLPKKRTFVRASSMSAKGQKADIRTSYDHLVGETDERGGDAMRKPRNNTYRLFEPLPMFGHAGSVHRKLVR